MSRTIDERVVEMRFDNKQFERNAGQTMSTLEKLKNALNFGHASDGLDKLGKAASNVNMNPLANGVEAVREKFSALEVMAVGALLNISNKITDAATHMAKLLTIDQVTAGWDKYAKKTSAVQTIMAATAQDFTDTAVQMEYVNGQLEKLNWFTDETSYNFVDMVGNIGKFTSNNIALEDSVTSMQGIATWAAISGANAGEASRAMYNLSQAIAVGSVKLIDWKSIENANMATAGFKQTVLETAASMGTLEKTADGVYKTIDKGTEVTVSNFNGALSEGWFTSEVLLSTLDKYGSFTNKLYEVSEATDLTATELLQWMDAYRDAGDDSTKVIQDMAKKTGRSVSELNGYLSELTDETYALGEKAFRAAQEAKTFQEAIDATKDAVSTGWMKTWEIIFGDYETAKVRWTGLANELYDIFAAGAEARNDLLTEALGAPKRAIEEGGWDELAAKIERAGIPVDKFTAKLIELGEEAGAIDGSTISGIDDFVASLKDGWLTTDMVTKAIDSFITPLNNVEGAVAATTKTFDDFKDVVGQVIRGDFGGGEERLNALAEAGWNAAIVQKAVDKVYDDATKTWHLSRITVEDFADAVLELSEAEQVAAGYTEEDIEALKALRDEYAGTGATLDDMRSGSELLFGGISQGWNAIKGIFSAMKQGWEIAFPAMTADRLYNILKAFNSLATRFNEWVGNFEEDEDNPLSQTVTNIKNTFAGLGSIVGIGLDALKAFVSFMSETFGGAIGNGINRLLWFTGTIGESLVNLREWLQENEAFSKVFETISSWIDTARIKFQEFIETVKIWFGLKPEKELENAFDSDIITGFSDTANGRFRVMSSLINLVQSAFSKLGSVLTSVFPVIKNSIEKIGTSISSFVSAIASAFSNGGFNAVLDLFNTGVMGAIGIGISKFFTGLGSITKEAGGFIGRLKSIGKSVVDTFSAIQTQLKSGALLKIAIAIGILSAALVALAGIPSEDLASSLGAITVLFGDLMGSLALFEKIMNGSGMRSIRGVSTSMIGLSISVLILASALKKIADVESSKLLAALGTVSALLAEMTGAMVLLSKYGGKIKTSSLSMVGLAVAVLILTKAVNKLGDLDTAQLVKGLVVVGALLTELAIFMRAAKSGGLKMTQATALVILAEALVLLEGPLDHFSSMSLNQIGTALLVMGGALAEIAIALKIMPKNPFLIGLGLLEVAGSLVIINGVLSKMSGMTWDQIAKGLAMLGGALVELSIAMNLMKGTIGGATAMLIMSTALLVLTPVLKALGGMLWTEIATGLVALAGAFAVIGIAGVVLSPLIPAILGLSAAITLLGVGILAAGAGVLVFATALGALSVAGAGAAASIVAIVEILIVGILDTIANSYDALGRAIKTMVLVGCDVLITCIPNIVESVLTAIKEVLGSLASNAPQIVSSLLQFIISVIDALAGDMPKVVRSVINLLTSLFSSVIDAITSLDTTTIVKSLEGIGLLSAMMLGFAGLSLIAPAAMTGVVEFGIVISELAVVLAAVGALSKIPGLTWVIGEGQELLQQIGTTIGSFVGGIVGGIAKGITDQLPTIAENLSEFMEGLEPFLLGAKDIDTTSLDSIKMLSSALLELTATSLIDQISSFFGGGIDGFGEKLDIFADAMVSYSDKIVGIDSEAVAATAMAGEALADLINALPKTGGIWQQIAGASDLDELSGKIVAYAEAITSYNDIIKGRTFDTEAIEASASAASGLIDLLNNMPEQGGWKGTILGDKTGLDEFGGTLLAFGDGLIGFCATITDVDFSPMDNAISAAEKLVALQAALPKEDGWLTDFFGGGQTDLSEFGTQISTFGMALSEFSNSLSGFTDTTKMENSITVAEDLIALASNEGLGKSSNLYDFGWDLKTFGGNLQSYYSSVSEIDVSRLSSVISQANRLVAIATNLSGLDTTTMAGFGTALKKMANNGITEFCTAFENCEEQVETALGVLLGAVTTAIESDDANFETIGTNSATSYLTGISGENETATTTGETLLGKVTNALESAIESFETAGKDSAKGYLSKIQNEYGTATTTGIALAKNVRFELTNSLNQFFTAGSSSALKYIMGLKSQITLATSAGTALKKAVMTALSSHQDAKKNGDNLGKGFIDGMKGRKDEVASAAYALGRAAIDGLKKAIDAHSPSRESGKLGDYTGIGYVDSLLDYVTKAYAAGGDVGTAALDGINEAIAKVSAIFDDETLVTPVIRPVVDLNDAQNSAQAISDMFNRSVNVTASLATTAGAFVEPSHIRLMGFEGGDTKGHDGQNDQIINQYNTFNITSNDPEEVARKVSRIIQRDVERRDSVWG